jgi:hypothetical protein
MTIRMRGIIATICVCAIGIGSCVLPNLLARGRQSDAEIQAQLLADMPLGSTADEVEAYARGRFSEVIRVELQAGCVLHADYDDYLTFNPLPGWKFVYVRWHFGADHRLTDVVVGRM